MQSIVNTHENFRVSVFMLLWVEFMIDYAVVHKLCTSLGTNCIKDSNVEPLVYTPLGLLSTSVALGELAD